MKKLVLYCCFFFSMMISAAHAGDVNKIIFFGDSLSDNGNLYRYLLHIVPKSPPYYEGRFTNGPTWAEHVANYFYQNGYIESKNYAVGGATAIFHKPSPKFIAPTLLEIEVDQYLLEHFFKDKSHTLFTFWIGGNDYLYEPDQNPMEVTDKVVNKIAWAIKKLYDNGARNFFVIGLPDLSHLPVVIENGEGAKLSLLSVMHNGKLMAMLATLRAEYKAIHIDEFDIYRFFESALSDPDGFNAAYHTHITQLKSACWKGSIWSSKLLSTTSLKAELMHAVLDANRKDMSEADVDAMVEMIANTPLLAQSYQLGQSYLHGSAPCFNPDDYLFWDHIHPTGVVHKVLADVIIQKMQTSMLAA